MSESPTINVMAPLLVGNPLNLESADSKQAWAQVEADLKTVKSLGFNAVSVDVWWGLVEAYKGTFDWNYYDRIFKLIKDNGLKIVPIISTHACGGNIGDSVSIPLPSWIWNELESHYGHVNDARFVSEQGNASVEAVSVWATEHYIPLLTTLAAAFQDHFAEYAQDILELNISLGPAGELRYPSYNAHDNNVEYPKRGALQCYSRLARESFRTAMLKKYGDRAHVEAAWGPFHGEIDVPENPDEFFGRGDHFRTQYGRDLIDWYNESLVDSGEKRLVAFIDLFNAEGAAFAGVPIGAKIPGIHWRLGSRSGDVITWGDRLAEVCAGLVRTSNAHWPVEDGSGYNPMLNLIARMRAYSPAPIYLHFTCIEMSDGWDGPDAQSLARSLVLWVGKQAKALGIGDSLKGENALGGNLNNADCWQRMRELMPLNEQTGLYHGITCLRLSDVLATETSRNEAHTTAVFVNLLRGAAAQPDEKKKDTAGTLKKLLGINQKRVA